MSTLTISHDADDGTVVRGTQRGDGSRTVLRTYGLKWGSQLGAWYLPNSRARSANRQVVDALAGALGAAGFGVDVAVADVSIADAEQARARLSADRAERLRSRAQRQRGRAQDRSAAAHSVLDAIPPGQPILVGHHSEGRHRRDLARADRAMRDAVEAHAAADAAAPGADAAERSQQHRYTLPSIGRRLDGLRADAASLERRISGTASPLAAPPPATTSNASSRARARSPRRSPTGRANRPPRWPAGKRARGRRPTSPPVTASGPCGT